MNTTGLLRFACSCAVFGLLNLPAALGAQVSKRPISDFISQQGTYCLSDGNGGCSLFVPPLPNFIGWGDPVAITIASVDYAGLANNYLLEQSGGMINLGTQTSGSIVERALPDGRADVSVVLHTTNALSWTVPSLSDFTGPLNFGARVGDVLNGAAPALAHVEFRIKFTNTAPQAPLPDLIQLFFDPKAGQGVISYAFQANASGLFCDGSSGTMNVSQTGNARRSNVQAAIVNLHGATPRCP
jgi:hypothetical protein